MPNIFMPGPSRPRIPAQAINRPQVAPTWLYGPTWRQENHPHRREFFHLRRGNVSIVWRVVTRHIVDVSTGRRLWAGLCAAR